jgi:hypothetical protein
MTRIDVETGFDIGSSKAICDKVIKASAHGTVQTNLVLLAAEALSRASQYAAYIDPAGKGWTSPVPAWASNGLSSLYSALWLRAEAARGGSSALIDDAEERAAEQLFGAAWAVLSRPDQIDLWKEMAMEHAPEPPEDDEA